MLLDLLGAKEYTFVVALKLVRTSLFGNQNSHHQGLVAILLSALLKLYNCRAYSIVNTNAKHQFQLLRYLQQKKIAQR